MDQGAAMRPGPIFFLGWARPESFKLQARKRPSSQAKKIKN